MPQGRISSIGNGFFQKFGSRLDKDYQTYREQPAEYSQWGDLPAGIIGGIARLTKCKIEMGKEGKKTAGKYYFSAAAEVVSPIEFQGMRIKGLFTRLYIPLHDTEGNSGKPMEEHFATMVNELKKIHTDMEWWKDSEPSQIEDLCADLETLQPLIRFSTRASAPTKEYPNPRTFHSWDGLAGDDAIPEDPHMSAQDDSGPKAPSTNGTSVKTIAKGTKSAKPQEEDETSPPRPEPKPKPSPKNPAPTGSPERKRILPEAPPPPKGPPQPETTPKKNPATHPEKARASKPAKAPEPEFDEGMDLAGMAERAGMNDEEAENQMTQWALEAGYTEEDVRQASSWEAVAEMIQNPKDKDTASDEAPEDEEEIEEETEEESAEVEIAVGNVFGYKPLDKATNKRGPTVEVTLIEVDTENQKVKAQLVDDPKKKYIIPFAQLLQPEQSA